MPPWAEQREILDGAVVLERGPGFLKVWHGRSAHDLDEAAQVLAAMDAAMVDWGLDRLLFDSRDADNTPPEVAEQIWGWLSGHEGLVRVATLVQSPEMAQRINMGGVGNDVRIRAFHSVGAARRWLTIL